MAAYESCHAAVVCEPREARARLLGDANDRKTGRLLAFAECLLEGRVLQDGHVDIEDHGVTVRDRSGEFGDVGRSRARDDLVAGRTDGGGEHVAEHLVFGDEANALRRRARLGGRVGHADEVRDVEELDCFAADFGRAHDVRVRACELDLELVLEDVHDLVGKQANGALLCRNDEHRIGWLRHVDHRRDRNDRHQAALEKDHEAAIRAFDAGGFDHLDARYQREGQNLGCTGAGLEHDEAAALLSVLLASLVTLLVCRLLDAEVGCDAGRIKDKNDGAVAQDGMTREHLQVGKRSGQRLHHDFLDVGHAVDDDAEAVGADAHHDCELFTVRRIAVAVETHDVAQFDGGNDFLAELQDKRVLNVLDKLVIVLAEADCFDDGRLGKCETLACDLNDECGGDRKRERDTEREAAALALHGRERDRTTNAFDIRAHDVHADAAAGDVRDDLGRREAGLEDEAIDLFLAHGAQVLLGSETLRNHLLLDALDVEALAVVGDVDGDLACFMCCRDADLAHFGLALGRTLFRPLDAVVGTVADEVGEGIANDFDELAIKLGVGTFGDEFDVLAKLSRKLAHEARQVRVKAPYGLHASAHNSVLKVARQRREMLQRRLDGVVVAMTRKLEKLVAREHKLGDQLHHALDGIDRDANGFAVRVRARTLFAFLGRSLVLVFCLCCGCSVLGGRGGCLMNRGLSHGCWCRCDRSCCFDLGDRCYGGLDVRVDGSKIGVGRALCVVGLEGCDDRAVVARGLAAGGSNLLDDRLDAVDGCKNDRDRVLRRGHAVAQHTHDAFGRVADTLKALEAQEARRALDGVNKTENTGDERGIGRIALELHELRLRAFDVLGGFRKEVS